MDCKDFEEQLDDYMNGELPPASRAAFEEHATECQPCRRKRDEAITLRNRLRSEFAPPIPDGPDAFHQFKREIALRENRTGPRRRFAPLRAFGLAAVLCLLVGYLLISVPVSYSLPSGMQIVLNFDPPLTEAPEFEGLILPREFYDSLATDGSLIENFTTVQGPDGLTAIEIEISSNEPEVAAKVYQTLITNYPALEGGDVEYRGMEELKREPVRIMLREKRGMDEILTDEEIEEMIASMMPDIETWVEDEIMPLVKGVKVEIDIESLTGEFDLDDIESKLEVKILNIEPGEKSDSDGFIKRKFIIKSGADDTTRIELFEDEFALPGDVKVMILKIDDGVLSFGNLPLDIGIGPGIDGLDKVLEDLDMEIEDIQEYLDAIDLDSLDEYIDKALKDIDPDKLDSYLKLWKFCIPKEDELNALLDEEGLEKLEKWIEEHADGMDFDADSPPYNGDDVQDFSFMMENIVEELRVSIFSEDDDFDLGAGGDRFIIEEIITREDRSKLRKGELNEDEFTRILRDRLNEFGYLDCDFKILINDSETSYRISVENGEVEFEFSLDT